MRGDNIYDDEEFLVDINLPKAVVSSLSRSLTEENLKIIEEILTTKNAELIHKLTAETKEFISLPTQKVALWVQHKLDKESMTLILDSLSKMFSFFKVLIQSSSFTLELNEDILPDKYKLAVIAFSLTNTTFQFEQNYLKVLNSDTTLFNEFYDSLFEIGTNENVKLTCTSLILSFWLDNPELVTKHDIINTLESNIKKYIVFNSNRIFDLSSTGEVRKLGLDRFSIFDKFDPQKDDIYDLLDCFSNLRNHYNGTLISYTLLYKLIFDNSYFLEKYLFMIFAVQIFTQSDLLITNNYQNKVRNYNSRLVIKDSEFANLIEEKAIIFIERFPKYKVPLTCTLQSYTSVDLLSKKVISYDDFIDYIATVPIMGTFTDFLAGKTDTCDFTIPLYKTTVKKNISLRALYTNFCFDFEIENYQQLELKYVEMNCNMIKDYYCLCQNLLSFTPEFKDIISQDFSQRLEVVSLLFFNTDSEYNQRVIAYSKSIVNYKLSNEFLITFIRHIYFYIYNETNLDVARKFNKKLRNGIFDDDLITACALIFQNNQQFVNYVLDNYKELNSFLKCVFLKVIANNSDMYADKFYKINDLSNLFSLATINIYQENPKLSKKVLLLLSSKKVTERKSAFTILIQAYQDEYLTEINQALLVETSDKLITEIKIMLSKITTNSSSKTNAKVTVDIDYKLILKNVRVVNFIPFDTLPSILDNAGEVVELDIVKASLVMFSKDRINGFSSLTDAIVADFDKASFGEFCVELFDFYEENGADTKHKWLLYFCAIYGSDSIVDLYVELAKKLQATRHITAKEVIRAIAFNNSNYSISTLDNLNRTYKGKSIKKAAANALETIAIEINSTREELLDKLIPDFGFDDENKIVLDYGPRSFNVYLNSNLEFKIVDQKGKTFKNMPRISTKDDPEIASLSYEKFKEYKKILKTCIANETKRLELTLFEDRKYTKAYFHRIFIDNPIMQIFATTLVWGVYVEGELTDTFRYVEDGSFNSVNGDEFVLEDCVIVGLVHPTELDENVLEQWKEQLEDYEISQPFLQLDRPCFSPKNEDTILNTIYFPTNKYYNTTQIKKQLFKLNMEDNFNSYIDIDIYFLNHKLEQGITSNLKINLNKDNLWVIRELHFTKIDEKLLIKDVPKKLISEIFYAISQVGEVKLI